MFSVSYILVGISGIFASPSASLVFFCPFILAGFVGYAIYRYAAHKRKSGSHIGDAVYVLFYTPIITLLAALYFIENIDGGIFFYPLPRLCFVISAGIIIAVGIIHIVLFIISPKLSRKIGLLWHILVAIFTISLPLYAAYSEATVVWGHTPVDNLLNFYTFMRIMSDSFCKIIIGLINNPIYMFDCIFMLCGLFVGIPYLIKIKTRP